MGNLIALLSKCWRLASRVVAKNLGLDAEETCCFSARMVIRWEWEDHRSARRGLRGGCDSAGTLSVFGSVGDVVILDRVNSSACEAAGLNTQNMMGGVKMAKTGDTMVQRFQATVLDADSKQLLDMYKARRFV
jgi:hypothetical protein